MNIQLSANDIVALILEKTVHREDFTIASNSSFLAVLSLLSQKTNLDTPHE